MAIERGSKFDVYVRRMVIVALIIVAIHTFGPLITFGVMGAGLLVYLPLRRIK